MDEVLQHDNHVLDFRRYYLHTPREHDQHVLERRRRFRQRRPWSFRRNVHRLREALGARCVVEVAEVCAQPAPDYRITQKATQEELAKLACALLAGHLDSNRKADRRGLLWIPSNGSSIVRLTATSAQHINDVEAIIAIFNECWISEAGWRGWLHRQKRQVPTDWKAARRPTETTLCENRGLRGRKPKTLNGRAVRDVVAEFVEKMMGDEGDFDVSDGWNQATLEERVIEHLKMCGYPENDISESTVREWVRAGLSGWRTRKAEKARN